jgi:recombinational DNA repair ATPase RecF
MKQHLENLTIERFRGLRDLELKDLGQVNLFVGPNNSGKTSALEAIATYCRPLDPLEWLNTSRRREIAGRGTPIARLSALRWLFPQSLGSLGTPVVAPISGSSVSRK